MATVQTDERTFQAAGEKLKDRVALVTGGTRGIGAAIGRSLAAQGASVAAGYSRDREKAEGYQHELEELGATSSIHQGNVASAEDCERTVREVIEQHGRLDILVNNAGITIDKSILKMAEDDWYKVLAVNLSGAFFMSKAALQHMLDRGSGRIVNISSIVGQIGNIGQTNYAASKSGMFGLTMSLAREAASNLQRSGKADPTGVGLTVNAVAPGFIETEMLATIPEKVLDKIRAQIPLGRLGRPDEVARVVHFLCADASAYITGQVWAVNGGQEM
jgi:NAD(P)-dependent dehydrogenase (short-subunit alcohol dehydrogenase family)